MKENNSISTEFVTLGLLAHVDAGKTTLSEGLLYLSGAIRTMGRVDNRDSFLDTDEMERTRGITIYAKQAVFSQEYDGKKRIYTLLDTPGHADFGTEMERTLSVLDAAVLLISAADGVNAQVRLLFSLLAHYQVPTILFVNKMDQAEAIGEGEKRKETVLKELREKLSDNVIDFSAGLDDTDVQESIAVASDDEALLTTVMEGGRLSEEIAGELVGSRTIFPVLFGSALRVQGVEELLHILNTLILSPSYEENSPFGAKIFKITRDNAGTRETWVKVTSGKMTARMSITYAKPLREKEAENPDEEERTASDLTEKISQIRLYSGQKYTPVSEAGVGMVCALTGLTETRAGEGLGIEQSRKETLLHPPLAFEILLPPGKDPFAAYKELQEIEEEEPMLRLAYEERTKRITAHLMGQVQREILTHEAWRRFHMAIRFGQPTVVYRETIAKEVVGVGHFEPLRHYAEVHLLLTPLEEGSGLQFESVCPTDVLQRQYQSQVLTTLEKTRFRGVLTGAELTDLKITLLTGRAHVKHTEGGDFRQATIRAVRQGLMMAENVLLEPFYRFELTFPEAQIGRVLLDLSDMGAHFGNPSVKGDGTATLTGDAPVMAVDAYRETFRALTKGEGAIMLEVASYKPCHDTEAVVAASSYDPELDRWQPTASVFCSHGAGTIVPWYLVPEYKHLDSGRTEDSLEEDIFQKTGRGSAIRMVKGMSAAERIEDEHVEFKVRAQRAAAEEEELTAIFERTYGAVRRKLPEENERKVYGKQPNLPPSYRKPRSKVQKEYLLVDGYNIIFAWEELHALANRDVKAARDRLLDILSDYAGYYGQPVICVFDAYKVAGGTERVLRYHNIDVVFTREAETADQYIEKTAHALEKQYAVAVATSDALEQIIIFGAGARRLSATDLQKEIERAKEAVREHIAGDVAVRGGHLTASLGDAVADALSEE